MKTNLILSFTLFILVAIVSSCAAGGTKALKDKFATEKGISPDAELSASPTVLYERAMFLRDEGAYEDSLDDFNSLQKLGIKEGENGIYVKREKAFTLIMQVQAEYDCLRLRNGSTADDCADAISAVVSASELLTQSLKDVPQNNEPAQQYYNRAKHLEEELRKQSYERGR